MSLIDELVERAVKAVPNEACGLVVSSGADHRLIAAKNLYERPTEGFTLDPEAWLEVAEGETVIAIYHSHPVTSPAPSMADLSSIEATGLPWYIVTPSGGHSYTEPSGYLAPYLGRPFVTPVHDCYSLVRDWYQRERDIVLKDYPRTDKWWKDGKDLYSDSFADAGFVRVSNEFEVGDIILMSVGASVTNHAAIYIGDGIILHHLQPHLSSKGIYGGYWQKHTTHHLRYEHG